MILFTKRHRWPAGLTSWFYYLLVLIPYLGFVLPVLGTVENGRVINPDRYSYLACLPCGVLAGAALHIGWRTWFFRRRNPGGALILGFVPIVLIVGALIGLTWRGKPTIAIHMARLGSNKNNRFW